MKYLLRSPIMALVYQKPPKKRSLNDFFVWSRTVVCLAVVWGLSLVEAVVKRHQGKIELTDNAPGLRVTLRLNSEVCVSDAAYAELYLILTPIFQARSQKKIALNQQDSSAFRIVSIILAALRSQ